MKPKLNAAKEDCKRDADKIMQNKDRESLKVPAGHFCSWSDLIGSR